MTDLTLNDQPRQISPAGPDVREKLRRIRDSSHPARAWARNVIQTMDEMVMDPDDPNLVHQLRKNVAMLGRVMGAGLNEMTDQRVLSAAEIVERFWLADHYIDPQ